MRRPLLVVVGTRPEAIKLAPVVLALRARGQETLIAATGQHDARAALAGFGLAPDIAGDCRAACLARSAAAACTFVAEQIDRRRPSWIVGQGDTTSCAAAALAAFLRGVPFAHLEAGLRTGDFRSPFPEEFNRHLATLAATVHFAPTAGAAANLRREGVAGEKIHVTGNTGIDALRLTLGDAPREPKNVVLVTMHRRENFGATRRVVETINGLAAERPDLRFVWVVHPNPAVAGLVRSHLAERGNIELSPPLSHPAFARLLQSARLILSDSGGVQEEATYLRRRVLVLRDNTERPEAVACGAAELVGADAAAVAAAFRRHIDAEEPRIVGRPFGDGRAAERVAEILLREEHHHAR